MAGGIRRGHRIAGVAQVPKNRVERVAAHESGGARSSQPEGREAVVDEDRAQQLVVGARYLGASVEFDFARAGARGRDRAYANESVATRRLADQIVERLGDAGQRDRAEKVAQ